jgi:hypothetical protein
MGGEVGVVIIPVVANLTCVILIELIEKRAVEVEHRYS